LTLSLLFTICIKDSVPQFDQISIGGDAIDHLETMVTAFYGAGMNEMMSSLSIGIEGSSISSAFFMLMLVVIIHDLNRS